MSHFQSYSYVSSNVNGKQNELFLHQTKNDKEDKKNFVAKKSVQGKNIKTLRGKSRNDEKWTIQQDGQKTILDKPFQDFENWFPQAPFGNFLQQHPMLSQEIFPTVAQVSPLPLSHDSQQSNNSTLAMPSYNPFNHDFFKN